LSASGVKANAQAYLNAVAANTPNTYWELFLPMQGGDQGTPVKAGDYSNNSVADAADYVAWRNSLGGSSLLNETVSPGTVDAADYAEWRSHFGTDYSGSTITTIIDNVRFANAGAGSGQLSAGGVPEPSSVVLVLGLGVVLSAGRRWRS
jgi:hypothetical protein